MNTPNQDEVANAINTKAIGINNFEIKQLMRYKCELEELKTKEVAYKETIEKGDSILDKVGTKLYKYDAMKKLSSFKQIYSALIYK